MSTNSSIPHATSQPASDPTARPVRERSQLDPVSRRFVLGVALGVGVASFLATELMHYLLVPDIGRNPERLLAEGFSAFLVCCLVAKLASINRRQRRLTLARMQVIAEMNHHIRNALTPISLSVDAIENQQLIHAISQGVERIDWALREILPREVPLPGDQRHQLGYFQKRGVDTDERYKSSMC
jgi:signal transduction histidine kinase